MSTITSVAGIRDLDGKFSKMIAIKERCDDLGIGYPSELIVYFGEVAEESVKHLREMMETVDISDSVIETSHSGSKDYQVDLSKLSDEVKAIRFTNAW